jgi:aminopeptidase YwaD
MRPSSSGTGPTASLMRPRRNAAAPLAAVVLFLAILGVGGACGSGSPALHSTIAEIDPSPTQAAPSPTAEAPTRTATAEPVAEAQGRKGLSADVSRLSDEAWSRLVELTDNASPRASASDETQTAADYLIDELQALGYSVEQQDFEVEVLAQDVPVVSAVSSGELVRFLLGALPITLSGDGTPTGLLVDVGLATAGDVPEEGLAGKIALVERGIIAFEEKVTRVADAGAIGVVIYNNRPGLFRGNLAARSSIPVALISRTDGNALLSLMAGADVEATVSIVHEMRPARNVIATKPGTADDGRVVVLGAHFDTVPDVEGANDNGSGTATILTIAAEIADRSYPFKVLFVAFGAEELGLLGSRHFVDALSREERRMIVAMLNFDALGTGPVIGVLGSARLADTVADAADAEGLTMERRGPIQGGASDHALFIDASIPAVALVADDFSRIHTANDTLEFVDRSLLGTAAALGIATLDALARSWAAP